MLPTDAMPASHVRAGIARGERKLKRDPGNEQARNDVAALRAEYAATKLAEYIERVVAQAPPLSPEQRSKLAVLLLSAGAAA